MKLFPRSLTGQMMLAVAVALLLAQGIGAFLAYRAGAERRETALLHSAAFRLLAVTRGEEDAPGERDRARDRDSARDRDGDHDRDRAGRGERDSGPRGPGFRGGGGGFRLERAAVSPQRAGDRRDAEAEGELRRILADQDMAVGDVVVLRREVRSDAAAQRRLERQRRLAPHDREPPTEVLLTAVRQNDRDGWLVARVFVPVGERMIVLSLLAQTLFIYIVLCGAIALILRRITRPLAALTERLERFAETRSPEGQLPPEGPDDVRRLIVAHNAMEARIAALLDEKDVMLGAIGHDLKTPLAALRVRIESVEDDTERAKMAATIEDITRSLDDILSLARVGRPSDPLEQFELSALVASVVEEYEDMEAPVELLETQRVVLPLRATWLRRGLRNLIDNALRYGQRARVSLVRESRQVVIWIEDDGPGIPEADLERMLEPFSRGDPSRNTATGGAGLGLTLARAIAEQHGGALVLANRRGADGQVTGLVATLRLPLT